MDWIQIVPLVVVPVVRSFGGWLEHSLKDGKIERFEVRKLGETIVRVGMIGTATFFGLNEMGIDVSGLGASFSAVIFDFILQKLKHLKK